MPTPNLIEELRARRHVVQGRLAGGALVLFSASVSRRNSDVQHPYRQHSDFFYLSGFEEPEAALVLRAEPPHFTLFVRERNAEREQWDGRRAGLDGAREIWGADQAFSIQELEAKLPELLRGVESVHYLMGEQPEWDQSVLGAINAQKRRRKDRVDAPGCLLDAANLIHELRRIKRPFEQDVLRRACELTARAHVRAMRACRPGMFEYELQAELEHEFRRGGARREAYEPIVGSGDNATILHYRENERQMLAGDLVLIDAGTELEYQAADITRTFPVSGRFSEPQRELYQIVLDAQTAALAQCRVGKTLDDVHQAAFGVITDGLIRLGLVSAAEEDIKKAVSRYFMHKTSHYLGMDVHDVGLYHREGELLPLAPGVVITVEPGVYVQASDESAPERYRGIGIRVEDDVLITAAGPEVLTSSAPREPGEIEELCQAGQ